MDNKRLTWLFNRYIDKIASPAEIDELFRLLEQPEHDEQARELMQDAWDAFQPKRPPLGPSQSRDILRRVLDTAPPPSKHRHWWPYAAVAATVALLILAGGAWLYLRQTPSGNGKLLLQQSIGPGSNKAVLTLANGSTVTLDSAGNQVIREGNITIQQYNGQLRYNGVRAAGAAAYNTLATPRGGQFRITLPDGTRVWLNSASTLRYPVAFTGKERKVELHGQAYFEIARNAVQPFFVKVAGTEGMEVQVLGTTFDIMAYAEESTVHTTLLEGRVQIKKGTALAALQPGQEAVLDKSNETMLVQPADVDKATAWKNGLFVFRNTDLETILREISRWYDVDISYTAPPDGKRYGGGISRHQQLADVLRLLEAGGNHRFEVEGRKITVLPSAH